MSRMVAHVDFGLFAGKNIDASFRVIAGFGYHTGLTIQLASELLNSSSDIGMYSSICLASVGVLTSGLS